MDIWTNEREGGDGPMDEVEQFIIDNEPVEQDRVVKEFGRRGRVALKQLMLKNRVSYSIDWKLVSEAEAETKQSEVK